MAEPPSSSALGDPRAACAIVALGQLATLALTWPLFGVRAAPPLLPLPGLSTLAGVPGLSAVLVVVSLVILVARPAVGGPLHLGAVLLACALDVTRFVPPVVSLAILGLGLSRPTLRSLVRAHLASMWLWAGVHKLLSPAYFAVLVPALTAGLPEPVQTSAGWALALFELALGVAALVPRAHRGVRLAAPALHLIAAVGVGLSGQNHGVIAWNVALAALAPLAFASLEPGPRWREVHAALLVIPALSYALPTHPTLSHHLYSGATPITLSCGQDGCVTDPELRAGLHAFGVPIPPALGTLEAHFLATCEPGERWLARSRVRGPGYGEVIAEATCPTGD